MSDTNAVNETSPGRKKTRQHQNTSMNMGKMNTLFLQMKFAVTSSVATLVDYGLYMLAVHFFSPVISNLLSYSTGMLVNFFLQKKYIFLLNRRVSHTFVLSLSFSLIGLFLSTLLIYILTQFAFFMRHQYITKFIVTGIIFFYNFYSKRFAFEK